MSIPRAKKPKRTHVPNEAKQKRIMEATWLSLACAIEQLWDDCGWRTKRLNNLVNEYYNEMCEAHRIYNSSTSIIWDMPLLIIKQAEELLGDNLRSLFEEFDDYRKQCYYLCVGVLVKALRNLRVTKTRVKLIVIYISHYKKDYELWSVYNHVAELTGINVRDEIKWN